MGVIVYPQPGNPSLPDYASSLYASGFTDDEVTLSSVPSGNYSVGRANLVTSPNSVGIYVENASYYTAITGSSTLTNIFNTTASGSIRIQRHWPSRSIAGNTTAYAIIYGDGIYLHSHVASTTPIYTNSGDPLTVWTARSAPSGTPLYSSAAFGSGETNKYVFVGADVIATSTDSITWTSRTAATSASMLSGTHGNGTYVFCGNGGAMQLSTDGVTWTAVTSPNNGNATRRKIIYANSKYITAGDSNTITHSTDAITWTSVTTPASAATILYSIAYGGDKYVAVGSGSTIVTSTDLITWTTRDGGYDATNYVLSAVIHDGSKFWVNGGGSSGTWNSLRNSTDGITWSRYYYAGGNNNITGDNAIYADGKVTFIGNTSQVFVKTTSGGQAAYFVYKYNS